MPKCIFCKRDASSSKSIEHIIPESLGNKDLVLPRGVVCDACNQYFAIKVEKPLLESKYFRNVRFRNNILSKKGRNTPYKTLFPHSKGGWADIWLDDKGIVFDSKDDHIIELIKEGNVNKLMFEIVDQPEEENYTMSRFLAKAALESLCFMGLQDKSWMVEIRTMETLDPLRNYARYGKGKQWVYNQRRIYDEEDRFTDPIHHPEPYEVLHEMDFLYIPPGVYYFVLVIMGVEYVINCGGSELDLFHDWLKQNNNRSPIHRGTERII